MIQSHPQRDPATVMPGHHEPLKSQRPHQVKPIRSHHTLRIGQMITTARRFVTVTVATQVESVVAIRSVVKPANI